MIFYHFLNDIYAMIGIRKTPTRKIPTHQTSPWKIPTHQTPPWKIPTQKIPTIVFKHSHPSF